MQKGQDLALVGREGQRQLHAEQRRADIGELGVIGRRAHFGAQREHVGEGVAGGGIAEECGLRIVQRHLGIHLGAGHRQVIAGAIGLADLHPAQPGARLAIGLLEDIAAIAAARQGIAGGEGGVQPQRPGRCHNRGAAGASACSTPLTSAGWPVRLASNTAPLALPPSVSWASPNAA